jgi:hypothetical protein
MSFGTFDILGQVWSPQAPINSSRAVSFTTQHDIWAFSGSYHKKTLMPFLNWFLVAKCVYWRFSISKHIN